MLIIALGVLTLMAILGAAFASLVRLEKKATDNYIDARRMDLLIDSAVDRVAAQLQGGSNLRHFTSSLFRNNPWLSILRTKSGEAQGDLSQGRVGLEDDRVGRWEVFNDRAGQIYKYKTRVIETSAQINLNGRQDTLGRMLDNLGLAIEKSTRLKQDGKKVFDPFYTRPFRQGNKVRGAQIVQLRRRLPEGKFTSKSQLRTIIGPENFEIVKDFVTVHSYEDPYTYKAGDGLDEIVDVGTGGGATAVSRGVGGGGGGRAQPEAYGVPRLDPEPRHPININTAPEEVLIACLQGLAGRRVFPFSRLGSMGQFRQINEGATIQGDRVIGQEEYRDITPRAIFVYSKEFQYEHAQKLALRIISQRKEKPFMAWRTNDPSKAMGFEDFIDSLSSDFFPSPQNCMAIDPDQPQNREIEGVVLRNGSQEIGRMWRKGTDKSQVRAVRVSKGLSFHEANGWYYDLIKGVVKANFNPNSRINRYNPNAPAFIAVDKSDLVWAKDRFTLLKGHTTEFCFDANGIYEVTTRGVIADKLKAKGAITTTENRDRVAPTGRVAFEKEIRSVVQVYDVLRHTNQLHFERTFNEGQRSSRQDRKYVVTWPDPMAALTELASAGSLRDGRVELAGLLDGRRLEAPVQQRAQSLRGGAASLIMAHTLQDRDDQSIANLRRVLQQNARNPTADAFTQAVREVLNPPYTTAARQQFGRYISRNELVSMGGPRSQSAQFYDPLVNREVLGTDLFPDGFHSSLLRSSHLQARVLLLPARSRVGAPSVGGDGDIRVGASGRGTRGQNKLGNVPYYKGGIAFWVKFDFDGDDPVFSGLIACTQVIKAVSPNASDFTGSEGTQFYVFKNMKGQLRVVRMYYHQAFLEQSSGGGDGGSGNAGGVKPLPDPGTSADAAGAASNEQNPIKPELDQQKLISRCDTTPVDISHFKAHEWHHIAIDWDDENPVFPVRLYVDFQDLQDLAQPRMAQAKVDTTANSWVRLNERQPRDGLQIGGIVREQAVADVGVFKWFTNSTKTEGGGGVETVAQDVKRILANATIDEFVTHDAQFASIKQYYGGGGAPGYFTNQPGEYSNLFEIPCPPDVDNVVLRSFDWTSYYPTTYTDSRLQSIPQPLQVSTPIRAEFSYNPGGGSVAQSFQEPWRTPEIANLVGGRAAYRAQRGIRGDNIKFIYKFRMQGAKASFGYTSGGVVQTPVIDDVTLTYFLPSPRILLQEEAD